MCGILGSFGLTTSPRDVDRALTRINHRGPDDRGTYLVDSHRLALGHVRLSILDLSENGHQPMVIDDGRLVLVYNGEIYNYRELRRGLERRGVRFRSESDTEVLLRLYDHLGESMLHELNGIFAFAIWDARQNSLLIARDNFGVKPLYYWTDPEGVVFSSELKALVELLPSTASLDISAVLKYLTFLWCPGEQTPLVGVRKLAPGHLLRVSRDGAELVKWLSDEAPTAKSTADQAVLIRQTRDELRSAVRRQMISDVPVGAFLSGGVDSSAIAALAAEMNPDLQTFTIDLGGPGETGFVEDLPFARLMAKHLGVELHEVKVTSAELAGGFEEMIYQLDEPIADPSALNVYHISKLARDHGIKVLLSGAGGDDVFSGYRRHRAISVMSMLGALPPWLLRSASWLSQLLPLNAAQDRRIGRVLKSAGQRGDARLVELFRWEGADRLPQVLSRDARQLLTQDPGGPMYEFLAKEVPREYDPLERTLSLERRFFLADHNLIYTDKMSMAAGVEARVPFLDKELVRFSHSIPSRLKQRGQHGKWILKEAMRPLLPAAVIERSKTGFGAPVRRWIKEDLSGFVRDVLISGTTADRGVFDVAEIEALIQENRSGQEDHSYLLLSLLSVEIWCRRFLR